MGQAPAETGRMAYFTHEPESHACKGADEWLSVQGSAPPIERNPVKREATAVRRWSFTYVSLVSAFTRRKPGLLFCFVLSFSLFPPSKPKAEFFGAVKNFAQKQKPFPNGSMPSVLHITL